MRIIVSVQYSPQNNPLFDLNIPLKQAQLQQAQQKSSTVGKQISIYAISFFLPPFGLIPAYKYLKKSEFKYKKIGYIAVALTITSILLSALIIKTTIGTLNEQLNSQQNLYNDLGF